MNVKKGLITPINKQLSTHELNQIAPWTEDQDVPFPVLFDKRAIQGFTSMSANEITQIAPWKEDVQVPASSIKREIILVEQEKKPSLGSSRKKVDLKDVIYPRETVQTDDEESKRFVTDSSMLQPTGIEFLSTPPKTPSHSPPRKRVSVKRPTIGKNKKPKVPRDDQQEVLAAGIVLHWRSQTMQEHLLDPDGHKCFSNFLKDDLSIENLYFIDAVNQFEKIPSDNPEVLEPYIKLITALHLTNGADYELNISAATKTQFLNQYNQGQWTKIIFDRVKHDIQHLLQYDCYSRYAFSPQLSEFVKLKVANPSSLLSESQLATFYAQSQPQQAPRKLSTSVGRLSALW